MKFIKKKVKILKLNFFYFFFRSASLLRYPRILIKFNFKNNLIIKKIVNKYLTKSKSVKREMYLSWSQDF